MSVARDKENFRILLIKTLIGDEYALFAFYQRAAIRIELSGKAIKLKSQTQIMPFFSPLEKTSFLLLNLNEGLMGILDLDFTIEGNRVILKEEGLQIVRGNELKILSISSKFHTAISTKANNIFLFDQTQMFVMNFNKNTGYIQQFASHTMFI